MAYAWELIQLFCVGYALTDWVFLVARARRRRARTGTTRRR